MAKNEYPILSPRLFPGSFQKLFLTTVLLWLSGCAMVTRGPSVAVMPGANRSFAEFTTDDRSCRLFADRSIGTNANEAGANNVITGAAVGTVVGAAAGALLGGHHGASVGAGAGLLMGTAVGAENANAVEHTTQRRYDIAYEQCMYAKGHQLPGASTTTTTTTYYRYRRRPASIPQDPSEM